MPTDIKTGISFENLDFVKRKKKFAYGYFWEKKSVLHDLPVINSSFVACFRVFSRIRVIITQSTQYLYSRYNRA